MKASAMNNPSRDPDDLVELLAKIEHVQWMHWSQAVAAEVSTRTRAKWQRSWVDYAELSEELKEVDRIWARNVVMLLRQRQLIS
jgi:hypothetical protein